TLRADPVAGAEPEPDPRGRSQGIGRTEAVAGSGASPNHGDGRRPEGTGRVEAVAVAGPRRDGRDRRGGEGGRRPETIAPGKPAAPGDRRGHSRAATGLAPGDHKRRSSSLRHVTGEVDRWQRNRCSTPTPGERTGPHGALQCRVPGR